MLEWKNRYLYKYGTVQFRKREISMIKKFTWNLNIRCTFTITLVRSYNSYLGGKQSCEKVNSVANYPVDEQTQLHSYPQILWYCVCTYVRMYECTNVRMYVCTYYLTDQRWISFFFRAYYQRHMNWLYSKLQEINIDIRCIYKFRLI